MITFDFWRVLFRSTPDHPLFIRRYFRPRKVTVRALPWYLRLLRWIAVVAVVLLVLPVLFSTGLIFGLVLAGATLTGTLTATGIALNVRHEYDDARFDVIATTPTGAVGMCTLLAIRFVRTHAGVTQIRRLLMWVYGAMTASTVLLGVVLLLTSGIFTDLAFETIGVSGAVSQEAINLQMARTLLGAWSIIVFMGFDLLQSTVLGAIVGMVVPHYTRWRVDAGLTAFAVFLTLQLGLYVCMFVGALIIPAGIFGLLGIDAGIAIIPIQIGIALGLRELLIFGLWRIACNVLNTDMPELRTMSGVG